MQLGPFAIPGSFIGDCRDLLARLPDESIHCVVTSPPYWGLRDYGIAPVVWGGDPDCEHEWGASLPATNQFCRKCGAWLGCLGLEPTPRLYVQHMVAIFDEVRRVLRPDGTLWLNMGDSYTSGNRNTRDPGRSKIHPAFEKDRFKKGLRPMTPQGLKPKDMVGIPWRVAFALQDAGWYLRSDIIWSKANAMPESITDRPTKAHEYIFLFTKSPKYFFDQEAVRERHVMKPQRRPDGHKRRRPGPLMPEHTFAGTKRFDPGIDGNPAGRNIRTVWTIPTEAYSEAHFATFPRELPKRCIMAGTKPGEIVLDPFFGSGTVGQVAESLGRLWIGFYANPEYKQMQKKRTAQTGLCLR